MRNVLLLFFIFLSNAFFANVTLPAIFCDHMVLQQKSNVNFWGTAAPNESITITNTWSKKVATVMENGNW
jgi:flagellar basal body L-ring protein FlgH